MNPTAMPATPFDSATRRSIVFLNIAHGIDHFVLLIYPTVVIGLELVYRRPYSELIAISSTAFVAFGLFSLPAGWLADHWSRRNMMAAFYLGCGVSLIGVGLSPNLIVLSATMFALGMFAAIYHPVGMAMLIEASQARGRTLAFNGVCGNARGVARRRRVRRARLLDRLARGVLWPGAACRSRSASSICGSRPTIAITPGKRQSKPAVRLTRGLP